MMKKMTATATSTKNSKPTKTCFGGGYERWHKHITSLTEPRKETTDRRVKGS
jgi:hypothetical protein